MSEYEDIDLGAECDNCGELLVDCICDDEGDMPAVSENGNG